MSKAAEDHKVRKNHTKMEMLEIILSQKEIMSGSKCRLNRDLSFRSFNLHHDITLKSFTEN